MISMQKAGKLFAAIGQPTANWLLFDTFRHFKRDAELDADGVLWVFATYAQLSERTGLTERQVARSLQFLRDHDWVLTDFHHDHRGSMTKLRPTAKTVQVCQ